MPPLGGEADTITISGWSGGSTTTNNFYVAFSDYIKGAGMIEGGQFGDTLRTDIGLNSAEKSIDLANRLAVKKEIADTWNMKDQPIFIFSGKRDDVYKPVYQEA